MASQAQIDANRRNSQRSTGPKSKGGKGRASLNALKDGSRAGTVRRVLPHENPLELDERIKRWIIDHNPRTDLERELVILAANLTWELDRARSCETARLAKRVRKAQHTAAKQRIKEVGELARRLLYNPGAKTLPTDGRPWEDNPAAFLAELEDSAEGCGWLLGQWKALRVLLGRDSAWNFGDMFRLIRLLGKYPIEAINDPELNAIFLAWDAAVPGRAERFWKECKQCKPSQDPGFSDFGRWREIADRPADAAAAVKFFETLIDEQIERLEELLELHEEIAGDNAVELADQVSSDSSARGERLRREQTAKGRELRQTVELLLKMRKAENAESHRQAAGDDGIVNAEEALAIETPALRVAMAGEVKHEPGRAQQAAAEKPKRGTRHSLTALEMVRSQRLDEQGFEDFFADPPTALVVLKGLRKLAERHALAGPEPVRGSGASVRFTSELGTKKAQIEANGAEAQVEPTQEDQVGAMDSGDENRSQSRDEDCRSHG